MKKITALALMTALAGPAAAEPAMRTETRTVAVSLDGSYDRYGESLSEDLRAGLEMECASELRLGRSALDWNLEVYYGHSRNRSDGSTTRVNSVGLDLAKIMLSRWRGSGLRLLKPYVLAGAELTWLREPDEEGGTALSRFVSPTVGAGAELRLSRRVSLSAEYRRNLAGGDRRVSGMTLGLSYAVFGADDEENTEEENTPKAAKQE